MITDGSLLASIVQYLKKQKEMIERKEITGATVCNYVKTIKLFCEMSDLLLKTIKSLG
jgi:hypothetical protein